MKSLQEHYVHWLHHFQLCSEIIFWPVSMAFTILREKKKQLYLILRCAFAVNSTLK